MLTLFFTDFETQQGLGGKIIYGYVIQTDTNYKIIKEFEFYSKDEFLDFFMKNPGRYIAHNGGRFDFPKLFRGIFNRGAILSSEGSIIKNGRIFKLTFDNPPLTELLDSYPIIPMRLKQFKKAFKLETGKGEADVKYIDPFLTTQNKWNDIKAYCRQDVITLIEGFKAFEQIMASKFGLNEHIHEFLSLPQMSFSIIRNNIPDFNKKVPIIDVFRDAYSGGRTEIFKLLGKGNLGYYDANSLYPTVMTKHEYPIGPYEKIKEIDAEGIVRITLSGDQPDFYIPPIAFKLKLPYMTRTLDNSTNEVTEQISNKFTKLYFPNINNTTISVTTAEARLMERLGYNFKVTDGIGSYDTLPLFGFMKELYDERLKQKGTPLATVIKLLMNSGYGKFGQRRRIEEFDPQTHQFTSKFKWLYTNTIIASLITANARNFMYETICKIGAEHVYYMDTDSLILDKPLDEDMIGNNLGQFKKEYDLKEMVAVLPKTYCLTETSGKIIAKAKGMNHINPSNTEDFNYQIRHGIIGTRAPSIKGILRDNMDETYHKTVVVKRAAHSYDKRVVIDSFETRAYTTQELQQIQREKWAWL